MVFNSFIFLVFASIFFGFWPLARKRDKVRWCYILCASFFFYGWWDWRFLFLITATGILTFYTAQVMERTASPRAKKLMLALSVCAPLVPLLVFKYSAFSVRSVEALLSAAGMDLNLESRLPAWTSLLPVGISFYTFQALTYTFDVYRKRTQTTPSLLHFMAYLSMFPQLLAGPIVRAMDLLPQLKTPGSMDENRSYDGFKLLAIGYFQKMVIADNLAPFVNNAFGASAPLADTCHWWTIMMAFAFQIYFDFAGYTNIARGLATWMGYDFPENFRHPYLSRSIREFWTRWHMTLSFWFRDYVYIPLGGSRKGEARGHCNLWATMLLCGLWHGAAVNFILWGAAHALFISLERLTKWPEKIKAIKGGVLLAWLAVLVQTWTAWVFFRAKTFEQAVSILKAMFCFTGDFHFGLGIAGNLFLGMAVLWEIGYLLKSKAAFSIKGLEPYGLACLVAASIYLRGPGENFVYFQF